MKTTNLLNIVAEVFPITRYEISKLLGLETIGEKISEVTIRFCQGPSDRNVNHIHLVDEGTVTHQADFRWKDRTEREVSDEDVSDVIKMLHAEGFTIDGSISVDLKNDSYVAQNQSDIDSEKPDSGESTKSSEDPVLNEPVEEPDKSESCDKPKPKRKHGKSRFKKKKLLESQQLNGLEPNGESNVPSTEEVADNGKEV